MNNLLEFLEEVGNRGIILSKDEIEFFKMFYEILSADVIFLEVVEKKDEKK